jgi:O-antigen/teichoic acid export membrane protein
MGQFTRNIGETMLTSILSVILGMILSILLARYLQPEDYGKYSFISLVCFLVYQVGYFAIPDANVFLVGKRIFTPSQTGSAGLITSFSLGVVTLLLFGLVANLGPIREEIVQKGIGYNLLWIALATVPVLMLSENLKGIFFGMEKIRLVNILLLAYSSFQLFTVFIFVVLLKMALTGAIVAFLLANIMGMLLVLACFIRAPNFEKVPFGSYIKRALSYSWKLHLGAIVFFMIYRLDVFLIVYLTGNMLAVGFYAAAVGIAEKIDMIPRVVSSVLFPRIATITKEEVRKYGPFLLRMTLLLGGLLALFLATISYYVVVLLLGVAYESAVIPLCILLPGVVLLGGGRIMTSELLGQQKTGVIAIANSTALVFNVVLNLLFIPKFGINAAAAVSSITYAVMFIVELRGASQLSGLSFSEYLMPQKDDFFEIRRRLFRNNTSY